MDNALRRMLNQSEWDLLRETEPARLRKKSEDDLVELHASAAGPQQRTPVRKRAAASSRATTKRKQAKKDARG